MCWMTNYWSSFTFCSIAGWQLCVLIVTTPRSQWSLISVGLDAGHWLNIYFHNIATFGHLIIVKLFLGNIFSFFHGLFVMTSTILAIKSFISLALFLPQAMTSSWLVSMPVLYSTTHMFVIRLQANTFIPQWWATIVSGMVLIPTESTPDKK